MTEITPPPHTFLYLWNGNTSTQLQRLVRMQWEHRWAPGTEPDTKIITSFPRAQDIIHNNSYHFLMPTLLGIWHILSQLFLTPPGRQKEENDTQELAQSHSAWKKLTWIQIRFAWLQAHDPPTSLSDQVPGEDRQAGRVSPYSSLCAAPFLLDYFRLFTVRGEGSKSLMLKWLKRSPQYLCSHSKPDLPELRTVGNNWTSLSS